MRGHDQHVLELVHQGQELRPPQVLVVHDLLQVVLAIEVRVQAREHLQVLSVLGGRTAEEGGLLRGVEVLEEERDLHQPVGLALLPDP